MPNPPRRKSRKEIQDLIISKLKPLGVLRISIFGSFAREESPSPRDIDILVKLPPVTGRKSIGLQWFVLDQELEEAIGMPIDLLTEDSMSPKLRALIEKDLITIYEKAG